MFLYCVWLCDSGLGPCHTDTGRGSRALAADRALLSLHPWPLTFFRRLLSLLPLLSRSFLPFAILYFWLRLLGSHQSILTRACFYYFLIRLLKQTKTKTKQNKQNRKPSVFKNQDGSDENRHLLALCLVPGGPLGIHITSQTASCAMGSALLSRVWIWRPRLGVAERAPGDTANRMACLCNPVICVTLSSAQSCHLHRLCCPSPSSARSPEILSWVIPISVRDASRHLQWSSANLSDTPPRAAGSGQVGTCAGLGGSAACAIFPGESITGHASRRYGH